MVWVTSGDENLLAALDASNGKILATIGVGSKPRFLAAGDGVVYTLPRRSTVAHFERAI
jgi:hypothetical protein